MKNELRDQIPFSGFQITEGMADSTGRRPLVVSGIFQKADTLNANNRVYPKSLWNKILGESSLRENISHRRMFGEVDHPADWRMALGRASHVITNIAMDEAGNVVGSAEILPTESGKIIEAIFRSKCEVGISSRGTGSTSKANEGHEVVGDDYQLETFDFVAAPSTPGAYPKIVQEAIEHARQIRHAIPPTELLETKGDQKMSLERFRAIEREASDLVELTATGKARDIIRERVEEKLAEVLTLSGENPTIAAISLPIVAALTQKRAELAKKVKEDNLDNAKGAAAASADVAATENKELDKEVSSEVPVNVTAEGIAAVVKKYLEGSSSSSSSGGDEAEFTLTIKPKDSDDSSDSSDSSSGSSSSGSSSGSGSKSSGSSKSKDSKEFEDSDSDSDSSSDSSDSSSSLDTDKVFATEAEIKKFTKTLAANPKKLESFLRNAVKRHNANISRQRQLEAKVTKLESVTEAVIRRFKKSQTEGLQGRYRFVCEAVAELKRRYIGLRRRFIVAESLAALPRKEKLEYVRTLSKAKTMKEMLAGIATIKAEKGIAEDDNETPGPTDSSDGEGSGDGKKAFKGAAEPFKKGEAKSNVKKFAEGKEKREAEKSPRETKAATAITEGAEIFRRAQERKESLR